MEFQELTNIARLNRTTNSKCLPQDSFELARSLNIRVKNSTECKQDFPEKNPLWSNNAIYALFKGEYTIYHDEKYAYKNFAIAHEIAHHLLQHESDGAIQHHDANILAAMLTAPEDLISTYKIKSARDLSLKCAIPISVAEEYWKHLYPKSYSKNICLILFATLIFFCIIMSVIFLHKPSVTYTENAKDIEDVNIQDNNAQTSNIIITVSGTKYHKSDCFHIKNKTNTIELSIEEAVNAGYESCKDCIK